MHKPQPFEASTLVLQGILSWAHMASAEEREGPTRKGLAGAVDAGCLGIGAPIIGEADVEAAREGCLVADALAGPAAAVVEAGAVGIGQALPGAPCEVPRVIEEDDIAVLVHAQVYVRAGPWH